jgi:hypothetical protein
VLLGNGDGTFATKTDFATGGSAQSVATGDLNGDGKQDLVSANHSTDNVSVLLGNGDGTFVTAASFAAGAGPYAVSLADLNGDRNVDVVAANANASSVSVLLGKGDGTLGAKADFETGASPQSAAIGDWNGDRKPDLAVANRNPSTVSILLNTSVGATPLEARAFTIGARTVPVGAGAPTLCIRIEPVGGSFTPTDVDPATVKLVSEGTGTVDDITSTASTPTHVADADRNGIAESSACFARSDLANLFRAVHGRRRIDVSLEGSLMTGATFHAPLAITVIGTHRQR